MLVGNVDMKSSNELPHSSSNTDFVVVGDDQQGSIVDDVIDEDENYVVVSAPSENQNKKRIEGSSFTKISSSSSSSSTIVKTTTAGANKKKKHLALFNKVKEFTLSRAASSASGSASPYLFLALFLFVFSFWWLHSLSVHYLWTVRSNVVKSDSIDSSHRHEVSKDAVGVNLDSVTTHVLLEKKHQVPLDMKEKIVSTSGLSNENDRRNTKTATMRERRRRVIVADSITNDFKEQQNQRKNRIFSTKNLEKRKRNILNKEGRKKNRKWRRQRNRALSTNNVRENARGSIALDSELITFLSFKNFGEFFKGGTERVDSRVLLVFFIPSTTFDSEIAPVLNNIARIARDNHNNLDKVGTVNCFVFAQICSDHFISEFPSMRWYERQPSRDMHRRRKSYIYTVMDVVSLTFYIDQYKQSPSDNKTKLKQEYPASIIDNDAVLEQRGLGSN